MNISIYCPVCARANIKRKLVEVDEKTVGTIYPFCRHCKNVVKIVLSGQNKPDIRTGTY